MDGVGDGIAIHGAVVAKPSLRWDRPSGGGIVETRLKITRNPPIVSSFIYIVRKRLG